jgi:hypothetical protein
MIDNGIVVPLDIPHRASATGVVKMSQVAVPVDDLTYSWSAVWRK